MKINSIDLNCRQDISINIETGIESVFCLVNSPAVYVIKGNDISFSGSSAVIFSSGSRCEIKPHKTDTLRYELVNFRMSSTDRQYIASMSLSFDNPVEISDDFSISSILKCMKLCLLENGKYSAEYMELSMRLIFINLAESISAKPEIPEIPKYHELKALRNAIYNDPMNEWTVDETCLDLEISRTYFHRLYLAAFGVTFRQDVIESRLIYASELLKNTNMSISAVAEKCGYESDSYFMRQFKKHKGCTPSDFRRRYR